MLALHFEGALRRSRRHRCDLVEAIFVGQHGTGQEVQEYRVDLMSGEGRDRLLPEEALAGVLEGLRLGGPSLSPEDIIKMRTR